MDCEYKKIIFFSRDLKIGGMEKALVSLLNGLAKKKYLITLVLENACGELLKELDSNVNIKEYRLSNSRLIVFRKIYNFLHRKIWSVLNRNKYDFSCNYATYSVIGSKLACIASKNSALYVHSNYLGYYQGDFLKVKSFFESVDIGRFKRVIFVSNESRLAVEKIYPQRAKDFITINNIILPEEILLKSFQGEAVEFKDNKKNLLFVGRLDDTSKNFGLLLESFKKAYTEDNSLRLYLIGDGPNRIDIERLIEKENINGVAVLGEKSNPYPYMKECDLMILTSKYEGYPMIYTESLILNKPFVTTVSVSDDYVNIEEYFTVTDFNAENISKAILNQAGRKVQYNIDFNRANSERLMHIENIIHMGNKLNEN